MKEMIKMVVVLTLLSSLSGGLLAYVKDNTKERIEDQVLQLVKGPTIKNIFKGSSNDPVADRFAIEEGGGKIDFFVAKFDGKPKAVAFETSGKGYGGDVGLLVAVDIADDTIYGVGVTTHSETAGLGSKAKEDPKFAAQFKGIAAKGPIKVSADGGQISALSGATITSRAVASAATEAMDIYQNLKPQIEENVKGFN
ncbi:MAG: RnfABCDGE type electron transport complex subunit G [Desulfobacterales bacterium]|jgi:electron transport complex protein RnfG